MLTIGRFADVSGLTVKALRYYDETGLLAPAHVDTGTGYRYYDPSQVASAVTIRQLRALELPLDEIRKVLGADAVTLRDHLGAHSYRVGAETHDKFMLQIEVEALVAGGGEPLVVDVGEQPELRLAQQIRTLHQDAVAEGITAIARSVARWLHERGDEPVGPPTAVFRGGGGREQQHLVEAGLPVAPEVEGDDDVAISVYPEGQAVTYRYSGDFARLHTVAQRFIATVLSQGHQVSQPIRIAYSADSTALLVWSMA